MFNYKKKPNVLIDWEWTQTDSAFEKPCISHQYLLKKNISLKTPFMFMLAWLGITIHRITTLYLLQEVTYYSVYIKEVACYFLFIKEVACHVVFIE